MSHLDEGTLHALLDGELDLAEVSEIQKHLGSCVACGSRLQEVKQVLAEADRLVGAVEVPAGASSARHESPRSPAPPPFRDREPPSWEEPPVLLVPDPIDTNARRKRWLRALRWAAAVAVVVYGGKMIGGAIGPSHPVLSERDLTSASPAVPPAVASREETRRAESTAAAPARTARPQPRIPAARNESRPAAVATQQKSQSVARVDESATPDTQNSAAADSMGFAAGDTSTDSLNEAKVAAADAASDTAVDSVIAAQGGVAAGASEEDRLATRRAAAAALAELDRERRRQRANAATAALPPAARAETAAAEPAARPPTLEQRAQVYLRIGLDEAVRQLGGPVHVIEGMTPEFIGLTRSQIIPGTNSSRPVVRVVYTDARGRLILLDQQRTDAPSAPSPSGSLRWTIGEVMLYLRGDVSTDVLRGLQARVR
ncbi:MAG TPA: zf-HC2 domain-containing protein [Gemmatimonadales bacterium]|nr:zf-HC2 domain-containing protein [Gemmatimonadales bacterium]